MIIPPMTFSSRPWRSRKRATCSVAAATANTASSSSRVDHQVKRQQGEQRGPDDLLVGQQR